MSRRGNRRRNWATLVVLTLVLIGALAVVVLEFADPATKARLYGWTGYTAPLDQRAPPSG
jgi:hypothetical protein